MSDLGPCFVVIEAPLNIRYLDGRDSGCRVGYLATDAQAILDLVAVGWRVLWVTMDELTAQVAVWDHCSTTHGDMLDKKGQFVRRTEQEETVL